MAMIKCPECGKEISDQSKQCVYCGCPIKKKQRVCVYCGYAGSERDCPQCGHDHWILEGNIDPEPITPPAPPYGYARPSDNGSPKYVSMGEAIKLYFLNYVNFSGRSTRSEYWWVMLINNIINVVLTIVVPNEYRWIYIAFSLGTLLPGVGLFVRRIHDTGKSWKYVFVAFIPIVGIFMLFAQLCQESDGPNQWGYPAHW